MEVVFTDTHDTLLDGRYLILRRLGQGAFGEVFLTRHVGLGVYRAVKRIRKSKDVHNTRRKEADALKNLRHTSLPIIYDIDEDDVYFYIVEEYIEGISLSEYVRDRTRLAQDETCGIIMSICTVLSYMQTQAGLLHLDIKPDNVLLTEDGVKLVDFGSSCMENEIPGCVMGTAGYAAPELYHGGSPGTGCDVYSLGMLMRFMLTGQISCSKNYICSENFQFIINKCTSQNASERFKDANELFLALEQSQKLFNKEITADPKVILVSGSTRRVGTTHFAIMLAAQLTSMGYKCLLELAYNGDRGFSAPLYSGIRSVSCHGGIYNVDGVEVLPDYKGFAVPVSDEERKQYIVIVREIGSMWEWDESTLDDIKKDTFKFILVTGHTLRELIDYETAAAGLRKKGVEFVSAVNFADGQEYIGIRKEHNMGNAFRIPYCTRPYSFKKGRDIIEKTGILGWSGKKGGNRCCRNAKQMWSNALCLMRRQLSVKRKKKACDSKQLR